MSYNQSIVKNLLKSTVESERLKLLTVMSEQYTHAMQSLTVTELSRRIVKLLLPTGTPLFNSLVRDELLNSGLRNLASKL